MFTGYKCIFDRCINLSFMTQHKSNNQFILFFLVTRYIIKWHCFIRALKVLFMLQVFGKSCGLIWMISLIVSCWTILYGLWEWEDPTLWFAENQNNVHSMLQKVILAHSRRNMLYTLDYLSYNHLHVHYIYTCTSSLLMFVKYNNFFYREETSSFLYLNVHTFNER